MGIRYSTPVPTDADFVVQHQPVSSTPLFVSSSTTAPIDLEWSCRVRKNAWGSPNKTTTTKTKTGSSTSTKIEGLDGIKIVPVVNGGNTRTQPIQQQQCLIQHDQDGTLLAILQVKKHREIQICTFTAPTTNNSHKVVVGEYNGKPFYEYATVYERNDRYRHAMYLTGTRRSYYQMERCGGPKFGFGFAPKDIVILESLRCGSNNNQGCVVAHVTEEPSKMIGCRVGPGIDPLLMIAFVVCSDKLRLMLEEMLYQTSSSTSSDYKSSNLF